MPSAGPSIYCGLASTERLNSTVDGRYARWLSENERAALNRLHSPSRRRAWLAGRWLSKSLIAREALRSHDRLTLRRIDITSINPLGQGTRPRVAIDGEVRAGSLSISHAAERVFVAWTDANIRIGADVVGSEPFGESSQAVWFSDEERRLARQLSRGAQRIWAAKEAAYKALNQGEGFAPKRFRVRACCEGRFWCDYQLGARAARCQIRHWQSGENDCLLAIG